MRQGIVIGLASTALLAGTACGSDPGFEGSETRRSALVPECVDAAAQIPPGAVSCGARATLECGRTSRVPFVVTAADLGRTRCRDPRLEVTPSGPLPLGTSTVEIVELSPFAPPSTVCTADVTVEDTIAPAVTPSTVELWPPNHRWVEIDPRDCAHVEDLCGPVRFRFTGVAVDEASRARGSGHTAPDVDLRCNRLRVRAERSGPGDGRVYRVYFKVEDAAGNRTRGTCDVVVPHDQSRSAVWSGAVERYRPDDDDCGGRRRRCHDDHRCCDDDDDDDDDDDCDDDHRRCDDDCDDDHRRCDDDCDDDDDHRRCDDDRDCDDDDDHRRCGDDDCDDDDDRRRRRDCDDDDDDDDDRRRRRDCDDD